jgi:hypothetical protein
LLKPILEFSKRLDYLRQRLGSGRVFLVGHSSLDSIIYLRSWNVSLVGIVFLTSIGKEEQAILPRLPTVVDSGFWILAESPVDSPPNRIGYRFKLPLFPPFSKVKNPFQGKFADSALNLTDLSLLR